MKSEQTYYIVFQNEPGVKPWSWLLDRQWQHCLVFFQKDADKEEINQTIRINCLASSLVLDVHIAEAEAVALVYLENENVVDIIKIAMPLPPIYGTRFRGLINCVSIVKAVLCIRKMGVLTPNQLYRYLVANGGESLKERSEYVISR